MEREREREGQFIFLSHFQRDRERKREKILGGLATAMSTGDSDGDCEGRGGELSRSICDERRRGETAICSLCDERRATVSRQRRRASLAMATTMIGFLIFSVLVQSLYWGFFLFFFGTESILSLVYCFCFFLVCFDFALIVIFRLSQYLRIDFLCDLCSDVTVVQWVSFISDFLLGFFFFENPWVGGFALLGLPWA